MVLQIKFKPVLGVAVMPMTTAEGRRVHERLDKLFVLVQKMAVDLATQTATCEICRPIVLGGDGKNGIDSRTKVLETESGTRRWWSGWVAGIVSGAVVGTVVVLVSHLLPS